jgi:hypothetical protein
MTGVASVVLIPFGLLATGFPPRLRIIFVVDGVVMGPAMFWYARVGVYETRDGIKVRTRFHTRDLTWEEIDFEHRSTLTWRGARRIGTVVLKNGSQIELEGDWSSKRIDGLNDALNRARSEAGAR